MSKTLFSVRELEFISEMYTNNGNTIDAARSMCVSYHTAKTYCASTKLKTKTHSITEMLLKLVRVGMFDVDGRVKFVPDADYIM